MNSVSKLTLIISLNSSSVKVTFHSVDFDVPVCPMCTDEITPSSSHLMNQKRSPTQQKTTVDQKSICIMDKWCKICSVVSCFFRFTLHCTVATKVMSCRKLQDKL